MLNVKSDKLICDVLAQALEDCPVITPNPKGDPLLQAQPINHRPPPQNVHAFSQGLLIRFNGGLKDDLIHSAPSLRSGDRRTFTIAATIG